MSTTNFWSKAHKLTGRAIVAVAAMLAIARRPWNQRVFTSSRTVYRHLKYNRAIWSV